jgi:alkane 1-monooxygenase
MDLAGRFKTGQLYLAMYGLWLLLPLVPMVSPWAVSQGLPASVAAWLPLVIGFVVAPILQVAVPASLPVVKSSRGIRKAWRIYLDLIVIASVPLQALMLIVSANFWSSGQLDFPSSLAFIVGVGSFSGFCAINVGHELLHFHSVAGDDARSNSGFLLLPPAKGASISKFLASLLLSSVWFGTFFPAHLKIHHLHVGTPKDCYTAKRGQTIYSFACQAFLGNFKHTLEIERETLRAQGKTLLSSPVLFPTFLSIALTIGFYFIWGSSGLIFFLAQSLIAILLLEWINYLQHYGIVRRQFPSGRVEPVREWHAWNDKTWIMDIYLLNLFRHSDHHMNPNKPFYLLSESDIAPSYPYPYVVMMLLSLIPPLFFSVTHRILDSHPMLSRKSGFYEHVHS